MNDTVSLFLPDLTPENSVCLSIVTDGVSNHSRPLGVVYIPFDGDETSPLSIFFEGGQPEPVFQHTGLSTAEYMASALPIGEGLKRLNDELSVFSWAFCYNKPFFTKFLRKLEDLQTGDEKIGVVLPRLVDVGALFVDRGSVPDAVAASMPSASLQVRLASLEGIYFSSKKRSFASICEIYGVDEAFRDLPLASVPWKLQCSRLHRIVRTVL